MQSNCISLETNICIWSECESIGGKISGLEAESSEYYFWKK